MEKRAILSIQEAMDKSNTSMTGETRMKYYICRRIKLLTFLQNKGFQYIMHEPDKYNPKYTIWLFEDTEEIRKAVDEYYENTKRERREE